LTQGTLALTTGKPIQATYSRLDAVRKSLWAERGFYLLQDLRIELEAFNTGQNQTDALKSLAVINYLVSEVHALDPRWLDFSAAVLMALLDYDHLKKSVQAKKLMRKFRETLEALYGTSTRS
jgi:hypothetical protein